MEAKERFLWSWNPKTKLDSARAIVKNFLLHWFAPDISRRSISTTYSFWLGTMAGVLFFILGFTGIILMFNYVPTPERAYWTIKDIQFVVPFGKFIRSLHRAAAHLMVLVVFLHMMRTFYTAAYKNGKNPEARRWINWIIGVALLLLTLFLSFTGYLLPWDQLAFWAITVGTNIAKQAPLIGEKLRYLLLGGNEIGANTLIRFYVLHCFVLPMAVLFLFAYHMWRIRKDGGLACVEQELMSMEKEKVSPEEVKKTYTLMGVKEGVTAAIIKSRKDDTVSAVPDVVRRILIVILLTLLISTVFALVSPAPLEEPANPISPPNPAKAPWYFLWLQELVAITTFKIGDFTVNGGFIGGILIPGILVLLLTFWPFLDKSPAEATGVWFHKSRKWQNIVFTIIVLIIVALILIGVYFRGPLWKFYWPWEKMPVTPSYF